MSGQVCTSSTGCSRTNRSPFPGQAASDVMGLEEVDQFPRALYTLRLNVVPALCWMSKSPKRIMLVARLSAGGSFELCSG